jgi:photosystem II protein
VAVFKSRTKAPPVSTSSKTTNNQKKPRVEDGIFGASASCFTKENELFVGRVAPPSWARPGSPSPKPSRSSSSSSSSPCWAPSDDSSTTPPASSAPSSRPALGLAEGGPLFGFTKANELFVGRLAQLGNAFSLIGEIVTGKGALAQLNVETGVPVNEIEPLILFGILFFFFAAINPGTGRFVTDDGLQ